MATFTFRVPTYSGERAFSLDSGNSIHFVGANGCGKTRLAVKIETDLQYQAHRISAHRALNLNPLVQKISEASARNALLTGVRAEDKLPSIQNRDGNRWHGLNSTYLLNDFDLVLQYLFAEQNNTALESHKQLRAGDTRTPKETKFEKLKRIWETLIPNRVLTITGDNIRVANGSSTPYSASEMSDGERAIFYLIGQVLAVPENILIIIDEPELHVHKAIISKLWDQLEAARPDCAFLFISHDLDFIASRVGKKYVIKEFDGSRWDIEEVPANSGFSEELTTKILGSRKPILFVEGETVSLDIAIYRNCYTDWTIIPIGSCESVIHAVTTMRRNASLTRITCSGIVDADDYNTTDIGILRGLGIEVLPVCEIENLLLLPDVARAIGEHEGYTGADLDNGLNQLNQSVYNLVNTADNLEKNVTAYCRRRIDRALKKIDLSSARTVTDIAALYTTETSALDINRIATTHRTAIQQSITDNDITTLLKLYDNKGLVNLVATQMKASRANDFESWVVRVLGNGSVPSLSQALRHQLPTITAA